MTATKRPLACALPVLLTAAFISAAVPDDFPSIEQMLQAKNWFFERAVHPETRLIYGRVRLEDADLWKKVVFPAPESIRNRFANDSELPNLSNCPMSSGLFIGQLVDIYKVTGDRECVSQAKEVFEGLKSLANASQRKGFIVRGLLPRDPTKAHFLNSSVDQYTFYVYGLYKYYRSSMVSDEQKREIRTILNDICKMIEEDGTILATNGIPAPVSDIEAIRSDRSSRMLQVYLVGHHVTGDPRWRTVYLEKVREANQGRLRTLLDPDKVRYPYMPRDLRYGPEHASIDAVWQTQYSLVPLVELEEDLALKSAYLEAMRLNARLAERYAPGTPALQIVMLAQNRAAVAPVATPSQKRYFEELKKRFVDLWSRAEKSRVETPRKEPLGGTFWHAGFEFLGAMEIYWTGLARGVFQPDR